MFCAIYISDFSAEAILRARPELRPQAVAVVEGAPPLAYVVAVNDAARRVGLHVGMARVQAEALQAIHARNARDSRPAAVRDVNATTGDPRFHLVRDSAHMSNAQENGWLMMPTTGEASEHPRNTSSYARPASRTPRKASATDAGIPIALCQRSLRQEAAAHAALLDAAHALSPDVEDTAADIIVLDLAGLDRLFGAPPAIARELARRIAEVGLEASIAIASNADCAMHAARGFPGTTIIPEGAEADRLGSLPIEVLCANYAPIVAENDARRARKTRNAPDRRGEETRKRIERIVETLDRWGIRNFRALAALPPVSLSERLGADGVRLQQLASGRVTRDLLLHEATLAFEEALELEYPVDLIEPLAFLLSRMIEQLCARLSARALSTTELRLRMELEHRTADEATTSRDELADIAHIADRKLTLPVPMNDARLFLKLLQLELQSNPPGAPVTRLWLSAEPSRPRVAQAGLFVPLTPEPEKLELTLARIHRVLRGARADDFSVGAESSAELRAGTPELLDTHQSDAFRMTRFRPVAPDEVRVNELRAVAQTLLPIRLYRPPLAAEVAVREGRPVRVVCAQLGVKPVKEDNLVWVAGPWRTSGNWWMEGEEAVAGSKLPVASEAVSPQRAESGERAFARDEWDVALAVTTITSDEPRSRHTHVALHRIYQDLASGRWHVSGSYD